MNKIKISLYLILVMIFILFIPYLSNIYAEKGKEKISFQALYDDFGDKVNIDEDGNVWFVAKTKKATSGTRFKTIGYTARFTNKDGKALGLTTRFKMEDVPPEPWDNATDGYYLYY